MTNEYQGREIKLVQVKEQAKNIKLYSFELPKKHFKVIEEFQFIPGQFIMLSIPGVGEAPFAPCSSPYQKSGFQLSVRKIGLVTSALDQIKTNTWLEFRGPYGNGFPLNQMNKKDLVLVAGGTGIAPLASLIEYLIINRKKYGKIYLLYGAKNSKEILFQDRIQRWRKYIKILLCVEEKTKDWKEDIGLVTDICYKIDTEASKTIAIMCGPPVMYKFMASELEKNGIGADQIYVSMEARMKCGIGKCQHCVIGKKYTCLDGPVFKYNEISDEL